MVQYSRQSIIDNGIKFGKSAGSIDRTLRKFGHSGLTTSEFNKISPVQNLPKDTMRNLGNFGAGLVTTVGEAAASIGRGTVGKDLYDFGKNLYKLPDAWLSTYNTNLGNLGRYGLSGLGWDITQGIKEHPIEAAIDFSTFGGGKALSAGKAALAESKTLNKLSKAIDK